MASLRVSCGLRLAGSSRTVASRKPCRGAVAPPTKTAALMGASYTPSAASPLLGRHRASVSTSRRSLICMASSLADMVTEKNQNNALMVYSKTYCPFCMEVKALFKSLGAQATVVELDELADGADVQDALCSVSGSRTVPQVFIDGDFIGGCDDTMAAHRAGKLAELLEAAGVAVKSA